MVCILERSYFAWLNTKVSCVTTKAEVKHIDTHTVRVKAVQQKRSFTLSEILVMKTD